MAGNNILSYLIDTSDDSDNGGNQFCYPLQYYIHQMIQHSETAEYYREINETEVDPFLKDASESANITFCRCDEPRTHPLQVWKINSVAGIYQMMHEKVDQSRIGSSFMNPRPSYEVQMRQCGFCDRRAFWPNPIADWLWQMKDIYKVFLFRCSRSR
uniref:Uncharacterized protein n=1 Tax=Panagrolaimus superbus TaxID=310955 RepID=A0A914YKP3_9BILA